MDLTDVLLFFFKIFDWKMKIYFFVSIGQQVKLDLLCSFTDSNIIIVGWILSLNQSPSNLFVPFALFLTDITWFLSLPSKWALRLTDRL